VRGMNPIADTWGTGPYVLCIPGLYRFGRGQGGGISTAHARSKSSSNLTMSSSPVYSPICTSISSSGRRPGFARRWTVPAGTKVDSPFRRR